MTDPVLEAIDAELERRKSEDERQSLPHSLAAFSRSAWPSLKPDEELMWNWHLDAICEALEAVSSGEIKRLQVWVPPVSMKTILVSVMWPAWEWTFMPHMRYWTASYGEDLSARISEWSRTVLLSEWYQARWGNEFKMTKTAANEMENSRGGTRLATSPQGRGTGQHGHRILIDDPIKPDDAEATSRSTLDRICNWYDSTVASRGIGNDHARVIVMQRLHQRDLAGYVLEDEEWEVLCLPERYEEGHPYAWRRDPREEGDLLWPEFRNEESSVALAARLKSLRVAGQMQQRPSAREGELLMRHWWRFYDPRLFTDERMKNRRPNFSCVVQSIDTPQKDKQSNDLIAIQAWGAKEADRYLLDLKKGHMNFNQAKRQVLEQARYVRKLYPRAAHYVLIENAGYGVELIEELKRELTGVQKLSKNDQGSKVMRAEAAAADLESGNCFLPGYHTALDGLSVIDEARSPAEVVDFVSSCADFPHAKYDDDVDAWSQAMNWLRARPQRRARVWSSHKVAA